MAAKKKPVKKTPARPKAPKPKPYNVLAAPYKTQQDFDKAVQQTASSQIQPQMNELSLQDKRAQSAHVNRNNEMGGWYQAASDAARAGAGDLAQANQNLMNSLASQGQGVQAGFEAALRQSQEAANAEAARLGGTARQVDPNMVQAMGGYRGAANLGLGGDIAGYNARASADQGIMGAMGLDAARAEQRRFQGVTNDLTDQRRALTAQMPGLLEQARQNLTTTELGRAGQSFQQNLANKQFGLAENQFGLQARAQTESERNSARTRASSRAQDRLAQKTFGEQKRAQRVSERQRDTELGISQQQADTQRAQIVADAQREAEKAGSEDAQAIAEAKGKQFSAGLDILSNAWKQTKNDIVYQTKDGFQTKNIDVKKTQARIEARMRGKFDDMLRTIMTSTGMGEGTALRVMMASPSHGWARYARERLERVKKARKYTPNQQKKPHDTGTAPERAPGGARGKI